MDNIINDGTSAPKSEDVGKPQENDNSSMDIDKIFGDLKDDQSGGNQTPKGEPSTSSPEAFATKKSQDDLFKEMKSRADKTAHELTQIKAKNEELSGLNDFINSVYEDRDVFTALIADIDPDLVKPKSIEDHIRDGLTKDFGADFVPDDTEENQPGSRTWLYNKRAEELYGDATKANSKLPENLKQLREKRKKAQDDAKLTMAQDKQHIMTDLKWDETRWNTFLDWGNKIQTSQLANIFNSGMQKLADQKQTPSLVSIPGGTPIEDNAYMKHLSDMFG